MVILEKNVRAEGDIPFINLLARIQNGEAWNGMSVKLQSQQESGENYSESDYKVLLKHCLII